MRAPKNAYLRIRNQNSLQRYAGGDLSVGADGVIFVQPPIHDGVIRFRIFNSDGSEAEMCGNGIRCFSKFVCENAVVRKGPAQC